MLCCGSEGRWKNVGGVVTNESERNLFRVREGSITVRLRVFRFHCFAK